MICPRCGLHDRHSADCLPFELPKSEPEIVDDTGQFFTITKTTWRERIMQKLRRLKG